MKVYFKVSDYLDAEIQHQPAIMNSWEALRVCGLRMLGVYLPLLTDNLASSQYDLFQFWESGTLWKPPTTLLPCLVHVAAAVDPCCVTMKALGRVGAWVLRTHWRGCVIPIHADVLCSECSEGFRLPPPGGRTYQYFPFPLHFSGPENQQAAHAQLSNSLDIPLAWTLGDPPSPATLACAFALSPPEFVRLLPNTSVCLLE